MKPKLRAQITSNPPFQSVKINDGDKTKLAWIYSGNFSSSLRSVFISKLQEKALDIILTDDLSNMPSYWKEYVNSDNFGNVGADSIGPTFLVIYFP